ncbi:hypothetical protein J437_LFUL007818 [Ladona fulva]|uniref:Retrovirus-related Pol polyprotein from transposon TNT 1-94 n=1 Tax=Ladona fulva TaxID=123851 RepID=A0A8K0K3H3_LADFU|nr:hypothetical protein J437_LFUL007818 [Ladona fulva]
MSIMNLSSSLIELLSKDKYNTWRMQVEALLIKNDTLGYVNGKISLPEEGTGTEALAAEARQKVWFVSDKNARSDLILLISPSELKQIHGCETSRDVWLKLESIYASKGSARKATMLKQLMLQCLEEGGDRESCLVLREHKARFFNAVDKLAAMDVDINTDLLSIMLLYSLLGSYARKQANVLECRGAMAASRRVFKASRPKSEESNLNRPEQEKFKF